MTYVGLLDRVDGTSLSQVELLLVGGLCRPVSEGADEQSVEEEEAQGQGGEKADVRYAHQFHCLYGSGVVHAYCVKDTPRVAAEEGFE